MNISQTRVVVSHGVERVVSVNHSGQVVEVRQQLDPRLNVISVGVQGPVGALADDVLQRTKLAEINAYQALALASDTSAVMGALLDDLQGSFNYHAGVISAQGD